MAADVSHTHVCPRCLLKYNHRRFVYARGWNALERIVARALHRFYGACSPCIRKFVKNGLADDMEIPYLRFVGVYEGKAVFSGKAGPVEIPIELDAPGPAVVL